MLLFVGCSGNIRDIYDICGELYENMGHAKIIQIIFYRLNKNVDA